MAHKIDSHDAMLRFEPFQSAVDATFWKVLSDNKINVYRLSDDRIPISGWYSSGDAIALSSDSESTTVLPSRICVNSESFSRNGQTTYGFFELSVF